MKFEALNTQINKIYDIIDTGAHTRNPKQHNTHLKKTNACDEYTQQLTVIEQEIKVKNMISINHILLLD